MPNHTRLAAEVGLEHPAAEEARRLDRKRMGKKVVSRQLPLLHGSELGDDVFDLKCRQLDGRHILVRAGEEIPEVLRSLGGVFGDGREGGRIDGGETELDEVARSAPAPSERFPAHGVGRTGWWVLGQGQNDEGKDENGGQKHGFHGATPPTEDSLDKKPGSRKFSLGRKSTATPVLAAKLLTEFPSAWVGAIYAETAKMSIALP
jgi:hypothetical protein